MTFEQAACFPVALQTMHNAVVTAGRLQRGETFLMQGASAGMGLMGMQIAKVMGASFVIGTSTNPARRARLSEYGADLALDTTDANWPAAGEQGDRRQRRRPDRRFDFRRRDAIRISRRRKSSAASSMSAGSAATKASSISTSTRSSASTISASPSAPAAPRKCARSTAAGAPTCGRRSRPASCRCRSTRPIRWPRSRRRLPSCAPISISARSSSRCHKPRRAIPGLRAADRFGINLP